ncbi:hypothetical protein TNCV_4167051 [Trichonephila clavipes]|nr:hypothetical protein TNCV_4167051 [Trichonephila clavipes]
MKKFDHTPYKLPPPTPIHVPAKKRPFEEKSLLFSKRRSKVRITPVIRRVYRRLELPMAPGKIQPVQIRHVPEPVQIPLVPEPPVQIPQSQESMQIPDVPEPIPEPVQILHVPEPVQIPDVPQPPVQIFPELDTLEPTDALDQLISFVFEPSDQELKLVQMVPSIFDGDLISSHSWINLKGSWL